MTSNDKPPRGLFVAGTDTNVGKTYAAAMIVRTLVAAGRRVGAYKPAASGCRPDPATGELVSDDAVALWHAAGCPDTLESVCPQRFAAPLAPHRAARAEGRELDEGRLRRGLEPWLRCSDVIVVEGAGGLFSPLGRNLLNIDLAQSFGFPLLVVAANRLGVVHGVLATLIAARSYAPALPVAGVVLNDASPDSGDRSRRENADELRHRLQALDVPLVAEIGFGAREFVDGAWLQTLALG